MINHQISRLALAVATLCLAAPAGAQTSSPDDGARRAEPSGDDFHNPIVVTAGGLDRLDMLAGTSVLDGTDLQRNLNPQLGEVLAKLPGVSATSFAPGASRPVLRGFSGERVRVLTDGIGALDASGASADHAVTVDPLIADRIEVLRGPAVLLYGSQAIGGAVNVITKRIPPRVPDEALHVDGLLAVDTAYNRREGGLSVDVPLSANVAFHVDGSVHKTDDMRIAGFAAASPLREDLLADAAEELDEGHGEEAAELTEAANISGRLPSSWTETYSLGSGVAFFAGESNIGLSVDYFDTSYGVPGLPGGGHAHGDEEGSDAGHEEENVSIGMKRYRADLRGELDLGGGFFESVQTRWAYSDYTHTEFEGDEIGTVFDVQGVEGRVELVQAHRSGWRGSLGGQYLNVDFVAIGEEAFVPPNRTESIALFALQEVEFDSFEIEFGGRFESTSVNAALIGPADRYSRSFGTFSGALGLSYRLAEELLMGLNASRAERAPSAQELFASGPHIATQQFEIGDPALHKESSWGAEAYLRGEIGPARMSASIYRSWFDEFIFLTATGAAEDGLPVFAFGQQGMDQFGIEGEVHLPLYESGQFTLLADLSGDYVRATLADGSPVPRIPPMSVLGALEVQTGHFNLRGEVQHFTAQDRIAPLETPTSGFTFVNLSLAWHPLEGEDNVTLILQADNLFDAEGRRHASFTKDFVPLAGRNVKLSLRTSL